MKETMTLEEAIRALNKMSEDSKQELLENDSNSEESGENIKYAIYVELEDGDCVTIDDFGPYKAKVKSKREAKFVATQFAKDLEDGKIEDADGLSSVSILLDDPESYDGDGELVAYLDLETGEWE